VLLGAACRSGCRALSHTRHHHVHQGEEIRIEIEKIMRGEERRELTHKKR
jgi:hypothetical protein